MPTSFVTIRHIIIIFQMVVFFPCFWVLTTGYVKLSVIFKMKSYTALLPISDKAVFIVRKIYSTFFCNTAGNLNFFLSFYLFFLSWAICMNYAFNFDKYMFVYCFYNYYLFFVLQYLLFNVNIMFNLHF